MLGVRGLPHLRPLFGALHSQPLGCCGKALGQPRPSGASPVTERGQSPRPGPLQVHPSYFSPDVEALQGRGPYLPTQGPGFTPTEVTSAVFGHGQPSVYVGRIGWCAFGFLKIKH